MTRLLADTHVLLWSMREPERLHPDLRDELDSIEIESVFSVISIWEIAIKANLRRAAFRVDAGKARMILQRDGWQELPFSGEHAIVAGSLPGHHTDPFDRALIAQAKAEGIALITSDRRLRDYGDFVRLI